MVLLRLAWSVCSLAQLLFGACALFVLWHLQQAQQKVPNWSFSNEMTGSFIAGTLLAATQAATCCSLLCHAASGLKGELGSPLGLLFDAALAWWLHTALLTRCGCGDLLAGLWSAGRWFMKTSLLSVGQVERDGGTLLLGVAVEVYHRVCRITCSLD